MNVMRAAIRPRATSPPTTPPTIEGVSFTTLSPMLLLVGVCVLVEGRREDSVPVVF